MHTSAYMCCRNSQMFLHITSPLVMFSVICWEMNTQAHFILHTRISCEFTLQRKMCNISNCCSLQESDRYLSMQGILLSLPHSLVILR